MKKLFIISACSLVLFSCNMSENDNSQQDNRIDSLQNVINQRDNEINELMGTFNEIQEGFDQINAAEGRVNLYAHNYEKNTDELQENILFIQTTMAENRKKIEELQNRIKSSGINASKLQATIDKLTLQLSNKDKELTELKKQLADKNIQIAVLSDSLVTTLAKSEEMQKAKDEVDNIVNIQDEMLNTGWYVYGTKKELKESKILVDGNVLKDGGFDADYFTKIDIRTTTIIPLYTKSAEILTTHPDDSYELAKGKDGKYTLNIKDPSTFWSISNYLVIKVK